MKNANDTQKLHKLARVMPHGHSTAPSVSTLTECPNIPTVLLPPYGRFCPGVTRRVCPLTNGTSQPGHRGQMGAGGRCLLERRVSKNVQLG